MIVSTPGSCFSSGTLSSWILWRTHDLIARKKTLDIKVPRKTPHSTSNQIMMLRSPSGNWCQWKGWGKMYMHCVTCWISCKVRIMPKKEEKALNPSMFKRGLLLIKLKTVRMEWIMGNQYFLVLLIWSISAGDKIKPSSAKVCSNSAIDGWN